MEGYKIQKDRNVIYCSICHICYWELLHTHTHIYIYIYVYLLTSVLFLATWYFGWSKWMHMILVSRWIFYRLDSLLQTGWIKAFSFFDVNTFMFGCVTLVFPWWQMLGTCRNALPIELGEALRRWEKDFRLTQIIHALFIIFRTGHTETYTLTILIYSLKPTFSLQTPECTTAAFQNHKYG